MKKILSTLLASSLLLSTASLAQASTLETAPIDATEITQETLVSGVCGPNATYTYTAKYGELSITGTGPLYDYEMLAGNPAPWENFELGFVDIGEGITYIGDTSFRGQKSLIDVRLPDTLIGIGYEVFYNCPSLASIYIPDSLVNIGSIPFSSPYPYVASFSAVIKTLTVYGSATSPMRDFCESEYLAYQVVTGRPTIHGGTLALTETYPEWMRPFTDFAEKDIITDLTVSNFDQPASRGLVALALSHMAGFSMPEDASPFEDTRALYWVVGWCFKNNIMSGINKFEFGTDDNVTREQMALILQQFATYEGKYGKNGSTITGSTSALNQYTDGSTVSSWAKNGVAWAVANGFMSGSYNKINPSGNITRAELAVMLYQYDQI